MDAFQRSRRENTLSIKYLAQGVFNDLFFPNQEGVRNLLNRAENHFEKNIVLSESIIDHCFLFHLEDFIGDKKEKDKSEIDLMIVQDDKLYLVEVKAFTDANALGVKREVIRNYLRVSGIVSKSGFFKEIKEIIPILLYSKNFQSYLRKDNSFNYFNNTYLTTKGQDQKQQIELEDLKKGNYSVSKDLTYTSTDIHSINEKLFFLTWEDVFLTLEELNYENRLTKLIKNLEKQEDSFKSTNDTIKLIELSKK